MYGQLKVFLLTRPDLTAAEEELMVEEDRLKRAVSSLYLNKTLADNKKSWKGNCLPTRLPDRLCVY